MVHTESCTNLLLWFKFNGPFCRAHRVYVFYLTYCCAYRVYVFCLIYYRAHRVSVFYFYVFCYVPYLLRFALVFLLQTLIWLVSCFTHGLQHDLLYNCDILYNWLMLSMVFYDSFVNLGMRNIFAPVLASPYLVRILVPYYVKILVTYPFV